MLHLGETREQTRVETDGAVMEGEEPGYPTTERKDTRTDNIKYTHASFFEQIQSGKGGRMKAINVFGKQA